MDCNFCKISFHNNFMLCLGYVSLVALTAMQRQRKLLENSLPRCRSEASRIFYRFIQIMEHLEQTLHGRVHGNIGCWSKWPLPEGGLYIFFNKLAAHLKCAVSFVFL